MGCASSHSVEELGVKEPANRTQPNQPKTPTPPDATLSAQTKPSTVPPLASKTSSKTDITLKPGAVSKVANGQQNGNSAVFENGPAEPIRAERKERRQAVGSEAVRNNIRKMAVGGPQTPADKANMYAISDSGEDDTEDDSYQPGVEPPEEMIDFAMGALEKNFVFKGIPAETLRQVIGRMSLVTIEAGKQILQQGNLPSPNDCMYVLARGEAEVVITGAVENKKTEEGSSIQGNEHRIPQKPGWVFGDVALLFNSARSASVFAKTDMSALALSRKTFLTFVLKHAQGARTLRFVRKLPLLKGLSDNDLIRVAGRMKEQEYTDGNPLIRYGERGDDLYLIRYGKVRVMRPDDHGGRVEVAVLGRGQFVGERTIITGKLRSADCVAQGSVKVVCMNKKDFLDLDNPLLSWMLDYDAIATVLRSVPLLQKLKQEQMEHIIDAFDAREEFGAGTILLNEGDPIEKLYVIKMGEVKLLSSEKHGTTSEVIDHSFVKEVGGFSYFGDSSLETIKKSPYTVVVRSESMGLLCLRRRALDSFLGAVGAGLLTTESMVTALKKVRDMQGLSEEELKAMVGTAETLRFHAGEVVVHASTSNGGPCSSMFLVKSGELVVVAGDVRLPEDTEVDLLKLAGQNGSAVVARLRPGDFFHERALVQDSRKVEASLVARVPSVVVALSADAMAAALGQRVSALVQARVASKKALGRDTSVILVDFKDLEFHRIVGTGQFGMVRVCRNRKNNDAYALKVMHKAPIVESKQIEHVINERKILQEAAHPFCVQLMGAYQDKTSLYLLQEWVPGGELFHHLDLEGAFEEPTAMFFAANVLLALEFLHKKGIVYRDLKPENLLLDVHGYIKMADFGFAKHIGNEKTYTICGTPDYQAPEVIMRRGTTKAADYWALGVLIFEMLVGDPPFKSLTGDPWDTFRRTLSGRFYVPNFISETAADLIFKLLQVAPEKRLGSGPRGADEIKAHPWFAPINWDKLERKELPAPIKPKVKNPLDTSNFDNFDNVDEEPPHVVPRAKQQDQLWELWEWIEDH